MTRRLVTSLLLLFGVAASADEIPNRYIDYDAFKANVEQVGELRKQRRVTEDELSIATAIPMCTSWGR